MSQESLSESSLVVGVKLPVLKVINGKPEYFKGEILAIKEMESNDESLNKPIKEYLYYIHYVDFNKRLDEWIPFNRLDLSAIDKVEWPNNKYGSGSHSKKKSHFTLSAYSRINKTSLKNIDAKKICTDNKYIKKEETAKNFDKNVAPDIVTPQPLSASFPKESRSSDVFMEREKDDVSPMKNEETSIERESSVSPLLDTPSLIADESDVVDSSLTNIESSSNINPSEGPVEAASSMESYRKAMESLRCGGSMTLRSEELARVKNIDFIEIGKHRVPTWYFSPYPKSLLDHSVIYICELCLEPFADKISLKRHRKFKCSIHVPPGNEIYRYPLPHTSPEGPYCLSLFEVDGHKQKTWCRNLCLLSKLFLDHKTLYYDADPFLFYVLTVIDAHGCHLVGYFSKEKDSADHYNVACILTLPQHQRKGYGKLLIALSYELSKIEGVSGSPEKPLSDLGLLGYRSYWAEVILKLLLSKRINENNVADITIQEISNQTSITPEDILHTLQALDVLKYYKGNHVIVLTDKVIQDFERTKKKKSLPFDSKYLQWKPPTFTAQQLKYI